MAAPRALTDEQVAAIRAVYATGDVHADTLAQEYGVAPRTIYRAVSGLHKRRARCPACGGFVKADS